MAQTKEQRAAAKRACNIKNRVKYNEQRKDQRVKEPGKHSAIRSAYVKKNRTKFNEHNQKQRAKDPEKTRAYTRAQTRRWYLKNKYGLTMEQYNELLEKQDHRCAICKVTDSGKSDWRVDHCHTTKKVRGLLCHNCNVSLGLMADNIPNIQSMLEYLILHQP